ncbi:flagellar hook-associated protein 2 [Gottschalkia acidurici 9a]|uniref:Flagellar hook-associated protein 2 n=1 Tax=Gottschalkia acidurici (strain ATCC 7906 / DSM 604 / BCRC 14475 / CIP 104303 / KCTC 5404 / NCIMB 10678 / 9a) TaxID=1128398 RepID=K0AY79_GOTA9|nr:flagellar filament capping protein FliD [Gottschalkia acidurici]AFS77336.1 flagellar hook-associated protein 2 [Gottschalkia acidurici 9a]
MALRLSGLASGIDTDSMVKELMKAERVKVDRVEQQKQTLLWKTEIYNSLNKSFANFILNARKDFGYSGVRSSGISWHKKAMSSNENIATASAKLGTITGKHDINVERIAEGISAVSKSDISKVKDGKKLTGNVKEQFGLESNDVIDFKITTDKGTVRFVFGETTIDGLEDGKVNGVDTIHINKSLDELKLSDIVSTINSASIKDDKGTVLSGLGMKTSYDSGIDRFFMQTTSTGSDASLSIEAEAGKPAETFFNALNLNVKSYEYDSNNELIYDNVNGEEIPRKLEGSLVLNTGIYKGINAKLSYNGVDNIEKQSNNFEINGVVFNIKDKGQFSVNVTTDADTIVEKVKNFIDEYNKIIEKAGSLLVEKVDRNYKPLTSEEKEAMTEKDIELWEKKARNGILRNDNTLNNTLSGMRSDIYEKVETSSGVFKLLTDIGISTQKYSSGSTGGKLELNEEALRAAIDRDADGVMEMLFKESDEYFYSDDTKLSETQLKEKRANSGIVTRIFDNLTLGIKDLVDRAGTGSEPDLFRQVKSNLLIDFVTGTNNLSKKGSVGYLEDEVLKLEKRIDDLNTILYRREMSYYSRFTAMEKAMQQMNSQSSWLAQQLGG